jgi:hypothetical protein
MNLCCRAALIALLAGAATARAVDTTEIKNKQIKCDNKLLATINLGFPIPYFDMDAKSKGVSVSGGAVATNMLKGELQWIQLIKTSDPFNTATPANTPYFDPGENDPKGVNYPFYWNYTLKARDGNEYPNLYYKNKQTDGGLGLSFSDTPTREYLRGAKTWQSQLSLVCFFGNKIGVLWTGSYGFAIDKDGNNVVNGWSELANPEWLTQAALDARYGKNTFLLSTDCADCLVPGAPSTALLLMAGAIARRRRR